MSPWQIITKMADVNQMNKRNGKIGNYLFILGLTILIGYAAANSFLKSRQILDSFETRKYNPTPIVYTIGANEKDFSPEEFNGLEARIYKGEKTDDFNSTKNVYKADLGKAYDEIFDIKSRVPSRQDDEDFSATNWNDVILATKKYINLLNKYFEINKKDAKEFLKKHPLYIDPIRDKGIAGYEIGDKEVIHLKSEDGSIKYGDSSIDSIIGVYDRKNNQMVVYKVNTSPADVYFDGEKILSDYEAFKTQYENPNPNDSYHLSPRIK